MDFIAMDKIFCHGQKFFVQDNLGFVLDKNYFVRAEGRGKRFLTFNNIGSIKVQLDWILATSFGANWITMGISSATLVSFSAIYYSKLFAGQFNREWYKLIINLKFVPSPTTHLRNQIKHNLALYELVSASPANIYI